MGMASGIGCRFSNQGETSMPRWSTPIIIDGKVVGRACHSGPRPKCAIDGCREPSEFLCDFPLSGKRAGKTCDRKLCHKHRVAQGPERDYCPTHDRVAKEASGD